MLDDEFIKKGARSLINYDGIILIDTNLSNPSIGTSKLFMAGLILLGSLCIILKIEVMFGHEYKL